MNILVVNMPCYGDNIPTLGFVSELVKRGHRVDVASSSLIIPRIKELINSTNANFIDFDINSIEEVSGSGNAISVNNNDRIFVSIIEAAYNWAGNYDAIVYDYFAFPIYYLLETNKTCIIRYFANFAFNERLINRIYHGSEKNYEQNAHVKEIGNIVTETLEKKGFKFASDNMGDEIIYNIPPLNIVHTLKDMQPYAEDFDDRFIFVGASSTQDRTNLEIPYNKMHGKIIYVSFGTVLTRMGDCRKELFEKIIETFNNEEVSVIIAIGDSLSVKEFSYIPDNFYIYNFVPQSDVLRHADLFITHCGMNSVNDSICNGVPMIAVPGGYDQFITAELIDAKKIGYRISQEKLTPDSLKELSYDILSNDEFKNNVRQMQAKMLNADCDKLTADIIEDYVTNRIETPLHVN